MVRKQGVCAFFDGSKLNSAQEGFPLSAHNVGNPCTVRVSYRARKGMAKGLPTLYQRCTWHLNSICIPALWRSLSANLYVFLLFPLNSLRVELRAMGGHFFSPVNSSTTCLFLMDNVIVLRVLNDAEGETSVLKENINIQEIDIILGVL